MPKITGTKRVNKVHLDRYPELHDYTIQDMVNGISKEMLDLNFFDITEIDVPIDPTWKHLQEKEIIVEGYVIHPEDYRKIIWELRDLYRGVPEHQRDQVEKIFNLLVDDRGTETYYPGNPFKNIF